MGVGGIGAKAEANADAQAGAVRAVCEMCAEAMAGNSIENQNPWRNLSQPRAPWHPTTNRKFADTGAVAAATLSSVRP